MSSAENLPKPLPPDEVERLRAIVAAGGIGTGVAKMALIAHGHLELPPEKRPRKTTIVETTAIGSPTHTSRAYAAAHTDPPPKPVAHITCAESIDPEEVSWLWPGRIAATRLTIFMGMPDKGKSTLMTSIAATITTGAQWPDCGDRAVTGTILYLQAEESRTEDIANRLVSMGADRSKIQYLDGVDFGDGRVLPYCLPRDCGPGGGLEVAIDRWPDVRAVMIDPLGAFMGSTNMRSTEDLYEALLPLKDLAERKKIAIIAVAHPNKNGEQDIVHRLGGSQALGALSRSLWFVSEDPNDPTRRMISLCKGNPKGLNRKPLAWSKTADDVITWDTDAGEMMAQHVNFLLQRNLREESLKAKRRGPQRTAARDAAASILEGLADGPMLRSKLKKKVVSAEISESSFWKCFKELRKDGTVVIKPLEPGSKKAYVWLADDAENADLGGLPFEECLDSALETARVLDS